MGRQRHHGEFRDMGVLRDQADDAVRAEAGAEAIDEVRKFGLIVRSHCPRNRPTASRSGKALQVFRGRGRKGACSGQDGTHRRSRAVPAPSTRAGAHGAVGRPDQSRKPEQAPLRTLHRSLALVSEGALAAISSETRLLTVPAAAPVSPGKGDERCLLRGGRVASARCVPPPRRRAAPCRSRNPDRRRRRPWPAGRRTGVRCGRHRAPARRCRLRCGRLCCRYGTARPATAARRPGAVHGSAEPGGKPGNDAEHVAFEPDRIGKRCSAT